MSLRKACCWDVKQPTNTTRTSQQHASVPQGWVRSDNCPCCHSWTEAAGQTRYLTQPQSTDTGPTSPSADSETAAPSRVATGAAISRSFLTVTGKFSVMILTVLHVLLHANFTLNFKNRGVHPFETDTEGRHSSSLTIL